MKFKKLFKTTALTGALIGVLASGAYAATGSFAFVMGYNGSQYSSYQPKADREQKAYVTPTSGSMNTYNPVRFNVRYGTDSATYYTSAMTSCYATTMGYKSGWGIAGRDYRLRGQNEGAVAVVSGRWTP